METPEKIYLQPISKDEIYNHWYRNKLTNDFIEYSRTNVFIDKACKWLSLNLQMLLNVFDVEYNTNDTKTEDFINDFRKAMKDK